MARLFSDHFVRDLEPAEGAIVELTRDLVQKRIGPAAAAVGRHDVFARETFDLLASTGILATAFPREYGGSDERQLVRVRIVEELGRACSAAASMVTGTDLSARALVAGASQALKRELLPRLARGEIQSVFGLTEPGAGSDVRSLATTATRSADGYVLNGAKKFITRAGTADWILAVARLEGVPAPGGDAGTDAHAGTDAVTDMSADMSADASAAATVGSGRTAQSEAVFVALLVPRGAAGLTVGADVPKLGWFGVPIADIFFRDVVVPCSHRIGEEGEGFSLAQDALLRARIGHASMALGRAIGAVEIAAAYAVERETFGKTLGAHQGVQWMFAEMVTRIEAARGLVATAADKYDRGDADASTFASMAKLHATDLGMQVTTDCLQLSGGRGYLQEFPLERLFRDAKLNQIGEGASEVHKTLIGREMMRRARTAARHPSLRDGPLEDY